MLHGRKSSEVSRLGIAGFFRKDAVLVSTVALKAIMPRYEGERLNSSLKVTRK